MNKAQCQLPTNLPMELMYPLMYDMVNNGGCVTFTVTGVSMQPMLYNRRDMVTIVAPPEKLKKNDLPFYKMDDGRFILHRVRKINNDGTYECRGDNRWESENNIRPDQIIGIVSSFTRNGKKISTNNLLYKLYISTWGILHYFKKFYKYIYAQKKCLHNITDYLKYIFKPIEISIGDNKVKTVKFRKATTSDISEIQKLCVNLINFEQEHFNADSANKYWFSDETGKQFFKKSIEQQFLWVAVCDKKIVGYIKGNISNSLSLNQPIGYLNNIYIEEEYRNLGIGKKLFELFKQYCLENKCHRMSVTFVEDNVHAEEFYKNNGFVKQTKTYKCDI